MLPCKDGEIVQAEASLFAKEKNGLRMSDEAFKMAYTDALSVCCKMLGFAADIYFEKDRTKYDAPPKRKNQVSIRVNQVYRGDGREAP